MARTDWSPKLPTARSRRGRRAPSRAPVISETKPNGIALRRLHQLLRRRHLRRERPINVLHVSDEIEQIDLVRKGAAHARSLGGAAEAADTAARVAREALGLQDGQQLQAAPPAKRTLDDEDQLTEAVCKRVLRELDAAENANEPSAVDQVVNRMLGIPTPGRQQRQQPPQQQQQQNAGFNAVQIQQIGQIVQRVAGGGGGACGLCEDAEGV